MTFCSGPHSQPMMDTRNGECQLHEPPGIMFTIPQPTESEVLGMEGGGGEGGERSASLANSQRILRQKDIKEVSLRLHWPFLHASLRLTNG